MKSIAIILFTIAMILIDQSQASRNTDRINQYRKRFSISGTRKIYEDETMQEKAAELASQCKSGWEDGEYGVISVKLDGAIANTMDGVARSLLAKASKKDLSDIDLSKLQLMSPKAYKIGCAENKDCAEPLAVCVVNKKTTVEDIEFVSDVCETCSPTFHKCTKICEPINDMAPDSVPEDEPEPQQEEESSASVENKETVGGFDNSVGNIGASMGLVFLSSFLFQVAVAN